MADDKPEITAPNFREANCCGVCKHTLEFDYDGNGRCSKYKYFFGVFMTYICDDFERREQVLDEPICATIHKFEIR